MKTVFSPFFHEYVRFSLDDARRETRDGREILSVQGVGTCSGRAYLVVLVDGAIDNRRTRAI